MTSPDVTAVLAADADVLTDAPAKAPAKRAASKTTGTKTAAKKAAAPKTAAKKTAKGGTKAAAADPDLEDDATDVDDDLDAVEPAPEAIEETDDTAEDGDEAGEAESTDDADTDTDDSDDSEEGAAKPAAAAAAATEEEEKLPQDAIVLSLVDDEDEVPVYSTAITGATADPVKDYLKQIGKVPLLNAAEEVELAMRIEAGLFAEEKLSHMSDVERKSQLGRELQWVAKDGQRAKSHLLGANLRLVVSLAKRYTGRGMQFLDLIQEGNLGLIRAVEKFDYTKGF